MTRTALFLSPHLDDVVFSCGGLAALLHDCGWRTILATAFTATVPNPTGFALACQLDKGLSPDIDYMAVRREEDLHAAAILGFDDVLHLGLPEAPHRGYDSAPALFGAIREDDPIFSALVGRLKDLQDTLASDLVLAPQGLGGHVDHLQMVRATRDALSAPIAWYRDVPYAIRHPAAQPLHAHELTEFRVPIYTALERKILAACAYASQIGFQFGGRGRTSDALANFARAESAGQEPVERLLVCARAEHFLRL